MEAMAIASNDQWQTYFSTIESVASDILTGDITTEAEVENVFDAAYES